VQAEAASVGRFSSAALAGGDIARGDLVFVGGERCQHFGLLWLWDLDEVQGPSEFGCDLIEFCGRNPEAPVGLFKSERRRPGLGGRELEGPERVMAGLNFLPRAEAPLWRG
jgi:hypothetical protein